MNPTLRLEIPAVHSFDGSISPASPRFIHSRNREREIVKNSDIDHQRSLERSLNSPRLKFQREKEIVAKQQTFHAQNEDRVKRTQQHLQEAKKLLPQADQILKSVYTPPSKPNLTVKSPGPAAGTTSLSSPRRYEWDDQARVALRQATAEYNRSVINSKSPRTPR
ncbi:hypothetical protein RCL1_005585 [Eukaryota sp. TZLM3-RCL]